MNLKEKALLVKFSSCQYSAKKHDKKVTQEVEEKYKAHDAGRYQKVTIAKEALEAGQKARNDARTYVYTQTLPYNDDGWRLLTSANYLLFTQEIQKKMQAIEAADRVFIERYPDYIEEAKARLNGLFNALDYPDPSDITGKFSTSITFQPIPEKSTLDDLADVSEEDKRQMGKDLEERAQTAVEDAMKDLWERLYTVTAHAAERLSDPEAIFRDSLIQNITDLCDLLPRLNLTNNPDLEAMSQRVKDRLTQYQPKELRPDKKDNPGTKAVKEGNRKQTAAEAAKILKDMEAYFTPPTRN